MTRTCGGTGGPNKHTSNDVNVFQILHNDVDIGLQPDPRNDEVVAIETVQGPSSKKLRLRGYVIGIIGVLFISPDSVLIKLASTDTSIESVIFFKYMGSFVSSMVFVPLMLGGLRSAYTHTRNAGWYFVIATILQVALSLTLTRAFITTSAANALVLFSVSPLWAAIGTRVLGEKIPWRTLAAIAISLGCGVAVVTTGSGEGTGVAGDFTAVAAGVFFGALCVCARKLEQVRPGTQLLTLIPTSSLMLMIFSALQTVGDISIGSLSSFGFLSLNGMVFLAIGIVGYTLAPRCIPH